MAKRKVLSGGRKRALGERTKSGRLKQTIPVTPEQIRHRAEELGLDPIEVIAKPAAVKRLCQDGLAGTAIGRLTWKYGAEGVASRRFGLFDAEIEPDDHRAFAAIEAAAKCPDGHARRGQCKQSPWLTDFMIEAADIYRTLWQRWSFINGIPLRTPKVQQFGHVAAGTAPTQEPDPKQARSITNRFLRANEALRHCPNTALTCAILQTVVIDGDLPESLLRDGDKSPALIALRHALDALHDVLCRGRRAGGRLS